MTPTPTVNVLIPIVSVWSALLSISATLSPFPHEPGFRAANVTPVMVLVS